MERTRNPVKFHINRKLVEDFVRYFISGVTSVVVQFGVLVGLVELFEVNATFSSASGFVLGCLVNYLLLYYWAFHSGGKHLHLVIRYILVMGVTLVLNVIIFWNLHVFLQVWYPISQSVATGTTALVNYLLNRNYTFV